MTDKLRHLLKLASNFSLSYLLCHLELSARSRLFPQHPSQRLLQCRNKYIRHIIADLAKHLPPSTEKIRPALPDSNIIWTMWSQGEHKAPPIIQQCIASMRQQDATVIVIDDTNIHDYIGPYPDSINRGLKDKTISLAHLSDYVRFTLLGRYGGLWLDSTVLCHGPLPSCAFLLPFYTFRQSNYTNANNPEVWWKAFVLGSQGPSTIFDTASRIVLSYWEKYDVLIDYYLVDHILYYLLSLPKYLYLESQIPEESKNIYWLQQHASDTWKDSDSSSICFISKLDYKKVSKLHLNDNNVLPHVIHELNTTEEQIHSSHAGSCPS
ncbi:capsular polysaccharide synthesis protein [Bifidobacterium pseudolongum]|uniref:capsular polysaccharide synthesis protein n=1 Tax=Bifidobacterium pseudolongum TaxID=1694 RepID=UPI00101FEEA4|nr:capsular polysaccharide synthesis protein [Bifidobacterium pseudolongum]RYP99406.1 capsular biosynthesis protein [Bifidobacterium pseudolongum subsp. globosum]RYQ11539.1 capsular biosynthesis protein [Bifidobacterium pseudolongum subsp. globosum]